MSLLSKKQLCPHCTLSPGYICLKLDSKNFILMHMKEFWAFMYAFIARGLFLEIKMKINWGWLL